MLRQPGDLGILRGVIRGFSEEARTRGFPSPSFGGFGFIGVVSELSIVARWSLATLICVGLLGSEPMSALGHLPPLAIVSAQGLLPDAKQPSNENFPQPKFG